MLDVLVNPCTQTLGQIKSLVCLVNQLGDSLVENARSLELGNELQRDCLPSTITTAAAATTTTKKEMLRNQQIFGPWAETPVDLFCKLSSKGILSFDKLNIIRSSLSAWL